MRKLFLILFIFPVIAFSQGGPNANMGGSSSQPPRQRATVYSTVTTSGSVPAGAKKIVFIFSSDFVGTIKGASQSGPAVAWTGANDSSFSPPVSDLDTLESQVYTIASGSMRIEVTK
jgi:hypothetical protein